MLDYIQSVGIVLILQFVVVTDSFGTTLFPIILAAHSDQKTILAYHYTDMPHSTCKENEYGPDCTFCVAYDTCRDGHYTCDNNTGTKLCMDGWKGADCTEKDVSLDSYFNLTCPENQCRNNGECVSGTCCCQAGFTGVLCQIEIIECQSRPCQNRASCLDLVGGYECFCRPGFTGKNCETRITYATTAPKKCDQHICQNGGACYEDTFSTYCVCPLWFTGEDCERDLRHRNLSQPTKCPAHLYGNECTTRCIPANTCDDGHYICDPVDGRKICLVGWKGDKCDIRRLPQHLDKTCPSDRNCKNGGQCFGGTCCCKNRYSGPVCNIESIGCHSNPCFNGGSCIDKADNGNYNYTCVCRGNFEGTLCERHKPTQATLHFTSDGVTDLPETSVGNSKGLTTQIIFKINHTADINHSTHVTPDALTNTNTETSSSKTTKPHSNPIGSQNTSRINSMFMTSDFGSNTPVSDPITTSPVTSDGTISGFSKSNSTISTPRTSLKDLEHRQSTDESTSITSKSVFRTSQKVELFMTSPMPTLRPEISSMGSSPAFTYKPRITSPVMASTNKGISANQFALESSSTQSIMPEITIHTSNHPAESLRTDISTETKKQSGTSAVSTQSLVSSSVFKSTESLLLTSTNYINTNDSSNMHTSAFISNRPPAGSVSLNTYTPRGTSNLYASTVGNAQTSGISKPSTTQHYSNSVGTTSSEILLLANKTVIPSELSSFPTWTSRTPSAILHSEPIAVTDFSKTDTSSRPSTRQMSSTPISFGKSGTKLSTIRTKPLSHFTLNSSTRNKISTIRNTHGIQQSPGTSEKAFSTTSPKVSSKAWTHILTTSPIISFIDSKRTMSPTLYMYLLSTSRPKFPSNNVTQMQTLSNLTSFKNGSTSSMSYLSTQSPTTATMFSLALTSLHESLKNASNETSTEAMTPNSENQTWWIIVVGIVAGVVLLAAVSVLFAVIFKYIISRESRTLKQSPEEIVQFDKEHFSMEPNFDNPIFLDEPDFQDDTTKSDIYVVNR